MKWGHQLVHSLAPHGPRFVAGGALEPVRSYRQEAWGGLKRGDVRVDSTNGPNGLVRVPWLSLDVLERALRDLIARHPVLNVRIEDRDDHPWLVPLTPITPPVRFVDFEADAPREQVEAAIGQVVWEAFDVSRGPLFRAYAVRHGSETYVGLVAHHFVADMASLSILTQDLLCLYYIGLRQAPMRMPPAGLGYGDYLRGLQAWIASPAGCAARQTAVQRLLSLPPLDLGPALVDGGPDREDLELGAGCVERVRAAARALSTSAFVILLAAQNMLLRRYSASSEVALKVITTGRDAPALLGMVGNLADRQYVLTDLAGADTFEAIVARTHRAFGVSQRYAFVRNDFVQRDLTDIGVVGAAPVFNFISMGAGRSAPATGTSPAVAPLKPPPFSQAAPTRPLDFYYLVLFDEGSRIRGTIRYGKGHIAGFAGDYVSALDRWCRDY